MNITNTNIKDNWYVVQSFSGKEEDAKKRIETVLPEQISVFLPKRILKIRRAGKNITEERSLYPGYFFVQGDLDSETAKNIKLQKNVVRILGNGYEPQPLSKDDVNFLLNLTKGEEKVGISKAIVEDKKVKIIDGPLKGIEGCIKKVDKRKGRAKVLIPIMNRKVIVDLCFEMIE